MLVPWCASTGLTRTNKPAKNSLIWSPSISVGPPARSLRYTALLEAAPYRACAPRGGLFTTGRSPHASILHAAGRIAHAFVERFFVNGSKYVFDEISSGRVRLKPEHELAADRFCEQLRIRDDDR